MPETEFESHPQRTNERTNEHSLRLPISTNQVDHNVRVLHALFYRLFIFEVKWLQQENTANFEEAAATQLELAIKQLPPHTRLLELVSNDHRYMQNYSSQGKTRKSLADLRQRLRRRVTNATKRKLWEQVRRCAGKLQCESTEYFGAFPTTVNLQRLSIQSVAISVTV